MSYIGTEPKDIRSFGRTKFDYTATQGQTAFTGADDDGKVLAFTTGQIEVYVNGILMDDSDFTTTGTGTVTLASAANLNDVVNVVSFETNIPDSNYVPASGGTFTGNITASGTLGVTGAVNISGNILPTVDNTSDLGSTSKKLKDLYLSSGVNIYNSSTDAVDIKGTGNRCEIDNPDNNAILLKTGGTTRVRIDPNGLKFNADTAAANALSDYEYGTWSGRLSSNYTGSITHFNNATTGHYVKVGRLVHFSIHITNGASGGSSSQTIWLTGLPFSSTYYTSFSHWFYSGFSNIGSGYFPILRSQQGQTAMVFQKFKDGVSSEITYGNLGGSMNLMIAGTYYTLA